MTGGLIDEHMVPKLNSLFSTAAGSGAGSGLGVAMKTKKQNMTLGILRWETKGKP